MLTGRQAGNRQLNGSAIRLGGYPSADEPLPDRRKGFRVDGLIHAAAQLRASFSRRQRETETIGTEPSWGRGRTINAPEIVIRVGKNLDLRRVKANKRTGSRIRGRAGGDRSRGAPRGGESDGYGGVQRTLHIFSLSQKFQVNDKEREPTLIDARPAP